MRATICILFLRVFSLNFLTQRYSCLNVIDLPMSLQMKSYNAKMNHVVKKALPYDAKAYNLYSSNLQEDPDNIRRTQKIPPKPPYGNTRFQNNPPKHRMMIANAPDHKAKMPYPPVRSTTVKFDIRRYFLVSNDGSLKAPQPRASEYEDEKDANLKTKISTLVQQTIHDTERKIKSIQTIKDSNREEAPYKAGFILSMIKKSRDVLNELFNVAVKHKDEWKALEQLKIFELIVHTNVDTTNLVRQLVEIHIQHLNATNPDHASQDGKKRVVLL